MHIEKFDVDLTIDDRTANNLLLNTKELAGWVLEPTYEGDKCLKYFYESDTYPGTADMLYKVSGIFKVSSYYGTLILHGESRRRPNGELEIRLGNESMVCMADFRMAKEISKYLAQWKQNFFPLKTQGNRI